MSQLPDTITFEEFDQWLAEQPSTVFGIEPAASADEAGHAGPKSLTSLMATGVSGLVGNTSIQVSEVCPNSIPPTDNPPTSLSFLNPAEGSEFVFESRGVILSDNSRVSRHATRQSGDPSRLKCEHPGCNTTFGRKYELQRHMLKHKRKHPCLIFGCDKTFHRPDKFREHLHRKHADTEEAKCPMNCMMHPKPLQLFALKHHVSLSGYQLREEGNFERRLLNNQDFRDSRHCPIPVCEISVPAADMLGHLKSHTLRELQQHASFLEEAGYDATASNIICPVCNRRFESYSDFLDHVSLHLVKDITHCSEWRTYARASQISTGNVWSSWTLSYNARRLYQCPVCNETELASIGLRGHNYVSHHVKLLAAPETIYPHRLALLRLWPEFFEHPVFDDLRAR